jgi:S-formylglutathione hydrolase FrmB
VYHLPIQVMLKITFVIVFNLLLFVGVSAQDLIVIDTDFLSKPDSIQVFVPDNYTDSNESGYALLYLLHGWSGNYKYWNKIIDCQGYANTYQTVIVCPDGLYNSWYLNSPVIENSQYQSFFFQELVPKIFDNYNIDTNNVFITGLSMGGHGALYLFAQKPELFKSAGSMSGTLDLKLASPGLGVVQKLGMARNKKIETLYNEFSVIGNIDKIKAANKPIIFSCGIADKYYKVNDDFRKLCDQNQIDATYICDSGDHNAAYWKKAINYHLFFFFEMLE